jgi:hypothetical protein
MKAPALNKRPAVEDAENDIGVADVNRQEH